jgi:uncharacterized spore protein YtfJ
MAMNTAEMLQSLIGCLQYGASAKTVFGDPIAAEGRTLIPVAKVGGGWGGGLHSIQSDPAKQEPAEPRLGFGAGFGAKPLGVIEVSKEGTKFISIGIGKKILGVLAVGLIVGLFLGKKR